MITMIESGLLLLLFKLALGCDVISFFSLSSAHVVKEGDKICCCPSEVLEEDKAASLEGKCVID